MNELFLLARTCIDRQVDALTNLYGVIGSPEYISILHTVSEAAKTKHRKILVAGVGKNSAIASKISDTMVSLGIPSAPLNVSHLGHGDYGRIGEEDVIIHISRSGTTAEMMEAISHISLILPKVSQILIHCKPFKPLNQLLTHEIFIGEAIEGDEFKLAPTTSTTALLCILDCLSVQVSSAIGFKRLDFLKNHPSGALGDLLKAEVQASAAAKIPAPGFVQAGERIEVSFPGTRQTFDKDEVL